MNCPACSGKGYFECETGVVSPCIPYTRETYKEPCDDCNCTGKTTEQQIVETLAMKVMGWDTKSNIHAYKIGMSESGHPLWRMKSTWNPMKSVYDAIQMLEQFNVYEIDRISSGRTCKIHIHGEVYEGRGETVQEAICQAALKAAS